MPKPSFGCSVCRRRRIKCDERGGGCYNCARHGVLCPGYQDHFDVLHRMRTVENASTLPGSQIQATAGPSNRREPSAAPELATQAHLMYSTFANDRNHVALAMFYASWCIDGSTVWTLDHLQSQGNGCLFAAMKVLGDLEISKTRSLPDGTKTMIHNYAAAISLVNSALSSPEESVKDSTLLATMILSAVEIKAAPSSSMEYWKAHTKGSAALLKLRGENQVTSRLGSALYFQVCSWMVTVCVLAREQVPRELHELRDAVQVHLVSPSHTMWRYQGALFRFANLVALTPLDVMELDVERAQAVVDESSAIYTEFSSIFQDAGIAFQYDTRPSEKFRDLLGYEHVYRSILAVQLWSGYRIASVVICTIVARIVAHFQDRVLHDFGVRTFATNAVAIINREALEAVAAVSQAFELVGLKAAHHEPPAYSSGQQASVDRQVAHVAVFHESTPDAQALPYIHGCLMQWSIYFAADSEFVDPRTRRCLVKVLDAAAQSMQVQQWQTLADKLKRAIAVANFVAGSTE